VDAIISMKCDLSVGHPQLGRQVHCCATSITTETLRSVWINVGDIKACACMIINQYHTISPNTKFAITNAGYLLIRERYLTGAIVNEYKIVARSLIFIKMNFHRINIQYSRFKMPVQNLIN
jgi:hypothetical protein